MKAASMSPRLPSALGRSGLHRFGISHYLPGVFLTGLLGTSLFVTGLPLAAQTTTSSAPQTTVRSPHRTRCPTRPGSLHLKSRPLHRLQPR